ncbi:MAG: ROK family protein [Clostridia bacterium]|nr:ROK family protein [Clostridia bacterium]
MYIGVDLGGTNIAIGVVDKEGKILNSGSRPTLSDRPYQEIVKDMAELAIELAEGCGFTKDDIEGIGIGSPGTIDSTNGVVIYANNLGWDNVPLAEELKKYIDVPIAVENDANAAAYGEFYVNGNGADSFIAITLGTGVGGGIIIDKKIYTGFNGAGGELGHTVIVYNGEPCTCGTNGCWEAYASVTALIRQTTRAIEANPDSLMAKLAKEQGKVSGRTSFDAAKAGDAAAQKVVDQYIEYVACGITNIINTFQPNTLVIGGGISKEGDYLLDPIKKYVAKYSYCSAVKQTEIKIATLMNDAGIIGAALASAL